MESRFLCAQIVRVDWMTGEDESRTVEAVLEDISQLGACVQVDENIPLGTTIAIAMGPTRFIGYVSYCAYRDYGYFVGIHFSDESSWSAGIFRPQHLTSLADLGSARNEVIH